MSMLLKNLRLPSSDNGAPTNLLIRDGRIAEIGSNISSQDCESRDFGGRLVWPGFVESHIHLDKSRIIDRLPIGVGGGGIEGAIAAVQALKSRFTPEDVYERAARTLEQAIVHGATHMRTHVEVDPVVGMRGIEGILPLIENYRWAIDLEICVFPQDGLTNNPGTEELMRTALGYGCQVVGAAPYTDTDPREQIDRVFLMAKDFDVDIDMHLDFGMDSNSLDLGYVCDMTERYRYGGRVTVGHVTRLSMVEPAILEAYGRRMADAGVALTVLPATDLYLMGRDMRHSVVRGVTPCHHLLTQGVNCALSTNNVLNPFTPFGDCSMIRMANLYANIAQVGEPADMRACLEMISTRPARILRLDDYGIAVGNSADFVVLDCNRVEAAVAELVDVLAGFKRGRETFSRKPVELNRPASAEVATSRSRRPA